MQEKNTPKELCDQNDRWGKLQRLWQIIDRLRGENGCPWDRQQTPASVQTYLVEEAHEAAAAIRAGAVEEAAEELGDLLFMVFFMIHLFEEDDRFTLDEVCDRITEKMIRRHPHVFGNTMVASAADVRSNWDKIKEKEKKRFGAGLGVPETLPALIRAYRLLSRVKNSEVLGVPDAEAGAVLHDCALRLERNGMDKDQASFWVARGLVALVALARRCGVRPEDCLHAYLTRMETSTSGRSPDGSGASET